MMLLYEEILKEAITRYGFSKRYVQSNNIRLS
jgi:hypothetical protein